MAGKDLFTDEEWARIAPLPGLVIIGATVSDGTGPTTCRAFCALVVAGRRVGSARPPRSERSAGRELSAR